eukprot:TRINITY_DN5021_c0_g1_i2.p1 TRINITY_DN5021_c0_g1~~TRINITY_DN5021_c0_g1_i2.p1  ORF type:complete len:559 (-),score=86.10 TRINITY_DN5021_c0_g1_i2:459-2135(-)
MKIRVRNLFVYFLFLVIPTLIGAVWLVLPLQFNGGTNELGFFIVVGVTFYWKFFCWMVFFDLLLPGCSKLLVVTTNVAFVLGSTVIYVGIAYYDLQQIKIVFSLIGLWDAVCSVTCYAVHIWRNGGKGAHSINTQRELGLDQPLLVDDADEVIVGSSSMNTFVIPDEPKVRVFNVNDPESATPITRLCLSGKDPANDEDASPVTGISAPNLLSFVVFDYDGGSSDDEDDNNTRNFFLEEEDDGGDDEYVQMPPGFLNSGDVHIDDSDMMRVSLTSNIASSGSGEGMDNSPAPSSSRISLKSRWKRRNLEEFVTEEVAVYKRWSEPLQYSACYYPSIDEKDGRRRSDKMSPTDPRRGPLSFKTLFWGITFRMAVFLIWFGVQLFTFYFLIDENAERAATGDDGGTQANVSEGRHSSLHLAIAVGVFQLLRFVSIFALVVLARQLPSIEETRYFPIFYVFMMFFFYYRHLFVKISGTSGGAIRFRAPTYTHLVLPHLHPLCQLTARHRMVDDHHHQHIYVLPRDNSLPCPHVSKISPLSIHATPRQSLSQEVPALLFQGL